MKPSLTISLALLILLFPTFQQCSPMLPLVEQQIGEQSSTSSGVPLVSVHNQSLVLSSNANFVITGDCDIKNYSDYYFQISYQENGNFNVPTARPQAQCVNGTFSFTVVQGPLGIRQGFSGVLRINIIAMTETEIITGIGAAVNISWTAGGTTGETCPRTDGTCNTPDPFATIGGGYCRNGAWVPADHPQAPACSRN